MCTTGCPTPGAHENWGECVAAKNMRVGYARSATGGEDYTAERKHQKRIALARKARAEGIQPDSTSLPDVQRAIDWSDKHGRPYLSEK